MMTDIFSKADERRSLLARSSSHYGSTPSSHHRDKMAAVNKDYIERLEDEKVEEESSTRGQKPSKTDQGSITYRTLTNHSVYIPPIKRTFYQSLSLLARNLIQFNYRPVSPYSNVIHTTKYTLLTFIPKNLFEQFHRVANLYFLLIIILNFIPAIEAFGKEVSWMPLTWVLLVTAIKDAIEDIRRYIWDRKFNAKQCTVFGREERQFVNKKWQDIRVGDFVRISCDEVIPADILVLKSSDDNDLCYIQTSNLDGETTLKQRHVPFGVLEGNHSDTFTPEQFTGELYCEQPHKAIYEFKGYINKPNGDNILLGRNNLLLRGCVLRNTDYVIGLVVYAGYQTKAMLNNSGVRTKRSKLERDINIEIIFQFIILVVLCLIGAIMSSFWTRDNINRNIVYFPFTSDNANPALEGFVRFWTFVITFQVIIPVSLYISMEIVKIAQAIFISWDLDMYHTPTDRPFQCKALNITEDLGQIQHIFTDKTGTLTENEMVFRCCTVAGRNYPHGLEEATLNNGLDPELSLHTILEDTDYPNNKSSIKLDPQLRHELTRPSSVHSPINDMCIVMAICNTVVVAQRSGLNEDGQEFNEIIYEAESSDEYALVNAASAYGYVLLSRSPSLIRLQTPHQGILNIELLHVLDFTPERKRMSVMVRINGEIILYSKGADVIMYKRLDKTQVNDCNLETQTLLNQYGRLGLRTLCVTKRIISEEDYQEWMATRKEADRDLENREQLILDSNDSIERQLQLIGATGIEDRLQDGVADTIQALRDAGIIVWVLTGDKKETAINVGYASHLLEQNVEVINLHAQNENDCYNTLKSIYQEITQTTFMTDSQVSFASHTVSHVKTQWLRLRALSSNNRGSDGSKKALVIDGDTLLLAIKPLCSKLFLALTKECSTVICCRAAPLQKAAVVQLIKSSGVMTLAIGDGANDVSMIQQANIGIGITGKEGMQAALASDFNMARFRFLKKLLLVHGHWCYSRLANLILYFFYKNVMYAVLIFWFQFFNGFSGTNPIDGVNLQIFNLVYTSMPIFVVGTADQDILPKVLLENKSLYNQGRKSQVYTRFKFWLIMLEAFYHSLVIFFVAYGAFYGGVIGVVEFGFIINISVVLVANLYLAIETLHWTWIHHVVLWGSCLMVFVFNYVYCAINTQQRLIDTYFVIQELSRLSRFWFVLIITPMIALFPRVLCKAIHQEVFPSLVLQARRNEKRITQNPPSKTNSSSVLVETPVTTVTQPYIH